MLKEDDNVSVFCILQVLKHYGLFSHLMLSVDQRSELLSVPAIPHETTYHIMQR